MQIMHLVQGMSNLFYRKIASYDNNIFYRESNLSRPLRKNENNQSSGSSISSSSGSSSSSSSSSSTSSSSSSALSSSFSSGSSAHITQTMQQYVISKLLIEFSIYFMIYIEKIIHHKLIHHLLINAN